MNCATLPVTHTQPAPVLSSDDFSRRPGKWNAKYYDYLFMHNYITSLQADLSFHTLTTTGAKQLT
jgi:hypothetical protein